MQAIAKKNPGAAEDGNRGRIRTASPVAQYPKGVRKSKSLPSAEANNLMWPKDDADRRKMREAWGLLAAGICSGDIQALRLLRAIEAKTHLVSLECWVTNEKLAALAHCGLSTVKDGLDVLARRGCIRWTTEVTRVKGMITGRKRVIVLTLPDGAPNKLDAMLAVLGDDEHAEGCIEQPSVDAPKAALRGSPKVAQRSSTEGRTERPTTLIRNTLNQITLSERADARPSDDLFEEAIFRGSGSLASYEAAVAEHGSLIESFRRLSACNAMPCYDEIHGPGSFKRLPLDERQRLKDLAFAATRTKFEAASADREMEVVCT
ncbi:hypothetical protein [Mangrovibrevibacter kandeliae]|uniref:hypothetical protein n=1 Tax=Mangrovibrevibacter kandeliae TaxID=2968473 RepID=UPI002119A90D|nr:hypothetical protein [Aurantimonas sp. CSK15Z-1]MCQ8781668.1 hypothetical protein [Aurantimonas sp. CSK15Z-1]